jgi:hypothetical protein
VKTALAPTISESTRTSEYDYRILFLSGTWQKPGSEFRFRATIYVQKDGAAEGPIYWQAIRAYGGPASYFATERVRGFVRGHEVKLDGYKVEPGLSPDSYRITLEGNDAGVFGGISRTYYLNWSGRMEGKYLFQNRKA